MRQHESSWSIHAVDISNDINSYVGGSGVQGNQGNVGGTGPQGNLGLQGQQGLQGRQGNQGSQGSQGTDNGLTQQQVIARIAPRGIILDTTTRKMQLVLTDPVVTNQCPFVASYADYTSTTYVFGANDGVSNGVTPVDVVAAPGAATSRDIKSLNVYNADTNVVGLSILYNDNGTTRIIWGGSLSPGDTLQYAENGFSVIDSSGQLKVSGVEGFQGPIGFQGRQGFQGAGVQGLQGNQGRQGFQGTGVQGAQGVQGRQGLQGSYGGGISIPYSFDTATADEDPGSGKLRFDNANVSLAQAIRISDTDSYGVSWSSVIFGFDDSGSTVKGFIRVFKAGDLTKWAVFSITGLDAPYAQPYFNVLCSCVGYSSSTPFSANDQLVLCFDRAGDVGAQGYSGLEGNQGNQGRTGSQGFQGNQGWQGYQGPNLPSRQVQITSNTTTSSTTWAQLLTTGSWTTNAATNYLIINFSACANNSNTNISVCFQITLDGTDIGVTQNWIAATGNPTAASLSVRIACSGNASHTVVVNWRTPSGTASIDPTQTHSSGTLLMHANLVIQEVAS